MVLAYHDIVPRGQPHTGGDASLHLSQEDFARQLDILVESHTVVTLDSILDPNEHSRRPRAAITFDDAYQGALSAGVDELVKRGLAATIFVAPGLLAEETWWDSLGSRGLLSSETRDFALRELAGDRERVLSWARAAGAPALCSPYRLGNESEVLAAALQPGITLGAHTWSHRNLAALSAAELQRELVQPLAWLTARAGALLSALTYPYGIASPAVERAAAAAGYEMAFRVDGGAFNRRLAPPRFALPRLNVPAGLSPDGFRLRLAGMRST